MLDTTGFFIKLFIDMEQDDLINDIEDEIEDKSSEMSLNDAINQVVKERESEILLAFRKARRTVEVEYLEQKYIL